jgi:hypothetical protein
MLTADAAGLFPALRAARIDRAYEWLDGWYRRGLPALRRSLEAWWLDRESADEVTALVVFAAFRAECAGHDPHPSSELGWLARTAARYARKDYRSRFGDYRSRCATLPLDSVTDPFVSDKAAAREEATRALAFARIAPMCSPRPYAQIIQARFVHGWQRQRVATYLIGWSRLADAPIARDHAVWLYKTARRLFAHLVATGTIPSAYPSPGAKKMRWSQPPPILEAQIAWTTRAARWIDNGLVQLQPPS